MKAVEKIKGYYEEHKIEVDAIASVTALSIGCLMVGLMVGYIMGDKVSVTKHARGLEKMCEVTPEFKEQYIDAMNKAIKVKLMES